MRALKGAELGRNLCTNPGVEVDLAGYAAANEAALSRVVASTMSGTAHGRVTFNASTITDSGFNLAGTATWATGTTYTVSLDLRPAEARTLRLSVQGAGAVGKEVALPAFTAGEKRRVSVTFQTAAAAGSVAVYLLRTDTALGSVDFDAVMIEVGSVAGAYYDGDTPDTETRVYDWAGVVGSSVSVMYERIPNLVVEPLASGPWAGVTVQGLSAGNQVLTVWRTAGGERLPVRGGRDLEALDSAYLIDYEVPLAQVVTYELEVVSGSDAGAVVAPAVVTVASSCGYIHDPLDPTVVVPVWASRAPGGEAVLAGTAFKELVHDADVSYHNIVGSRLPVAIGGARQAPAGVNLSMLTDAEAQNTRLRDMLGNTSLLVVRGLPGWVADAWPPVAYVSAPSVVEFPLTAHLQAGVGRYLTRWELVGRRVRGSSATVLIALFTYDDVAALFATYDQKQAAAGGGTYLDDLKNPLNA